MTLLIDTSAVAVEERAQFWADESCGRFQPLHITIGANVHFAARMWGDRLASIRLFRIVAGANTMTRTAADVAAGDPDSLHFEILLRGSLKGAQNDRALAMGAGDMVAYDSSRTLAVRACDPFDLLVLQVPKELLGKGGSTIAKQTAVRIAGEHGLPRLTARFLLDTAGGVAGGDISHDDTGLQGHIVDLIRRLYTDLSITSHPTRPRCPAELLLGAQAQIESRLSDPDLSPDDVAHACFISTRYLHRVFASEGLSVCDFIRAERLERCRRDLIDPRLSGHQIHEIATRWGLPNPAHFSRLFRERFGCSPREFRGSGGAAAADALAGTGEEGGPHGRRHGNPFGPAPDQEDRAAMWSHAKWRAAE